MAMTFGEWRRENSGTYADYEEYLQELAGVRVLSAQAGRMYTQAEMDEALLLRGGDFTSGAGPDAWCGCGERITWYGGTWMHIINPELRGTNDHDAEPGDPEDVDWTGYEDEDEEDES